MGEELRRPWSEGPDEEASPESWLLLDDDELLHRIETFDARENEDERLLEVVASDRHFFIRQEAAKRVQDRTRLFAYEEDRHVGQILVRHLTRREDMTYLERLSSRSTHKEVRSAAQVQLARLWRRLDGPTPDTKPVPAVDASQVSEQALAAVRGETETPAVAGPAADRPAAGDVLADAAALSPSDRAPAAAAPAPAASATAIEKTGVDGSLLAWAAHFVVEQVWPHVGTQGAHDLLSRTRRELLDRHPTLVLFEVTKDAHVATNLVAGPRLPGDAVRAVAAWMVAYRAAVMEVAPGVEKSSVRAATSMVADALRDAGFYAACDEEEASGRG